MKLYQPLEVGTDGAGSVILNHVRLPVDRDGIGHLLFTSDQGMAFGRLLILKSEKAALEKPTKLIAARAAA